ncbi:MAG: porin [Polyangiaceae bacterium]
MRLSLSALSGLLIFAGSMLAAPPALAQDDDREPASSEDEREEKDDEEADEDEDEEEEKEAPEPPAAERTEASETKPTSSATEPGANEAAAAKAAPTTNVLGWRRDDLNSVLGGGDQYPQIDIGGYVRGGFAGVVRPAALPADQKVYGFTGRAGLRFDGAAHRMWRARLWLEFRLDAFKAVSKVEQFDIGGTPVNKFTISDTAGILIEQAVASFVPWEPLAIEAGIQRIPFTLQQQSKNTATLFPSRSSANQVFFSGSDVGALIRGRFFDGIFYTSLGVWEGSSLGLNLADTTPRGVTLSYRADINPFGDFPFGEGDKERGPFRLGLGFGGIYRPTTIYDKSSRTEARTLNDLRVAGSLRMAWAGFFVAAEYFRRHQFDDFSYRPRVADGAYGQLAYYFPIADVLALEPSARAGFVNDDQTFDPRLTGYIDAGLSIYPIVEDPGAVRIWLTYLGERRFTEGEEAHGGTAELQVRF